MQYKGISGKTYNVIDTSGTAGGEGTVYKILWNDGLLVKIYKSENRTDKLDRKLRYMYDNRKYIEADKIDADFIAWTKDLILESGRCIGYVMAKAKGVQLSKLLVLDKGDPLEKLPWNKRLKIAYNLCIAVHNVHDDGIIIGDFNPNNFFVDTDSCKVTIIDAASFHLNDGDFRCVVAKEEYIAPELQRAMKRSAQTLEEIASTFTKETDYFGLAVQVFRLLMQGFHPASRRVTRNGPSESGKIDDHILKGEYEYFKPVPGFDIPKRSPSIDILPTTLRDLFKKSFVSSHDDPALRPSAEKFADALRSAEKNICQCGRENWHFYWTGCPSCPWCALEKPSVSPVKQQLNPQPTQKFKSNSAKVVFVLLIALLIGILVGTIWGEIAFVNSGIPNEWIAALTGKHVYVYIIVGCALIGALIGGIKSDAFDNEIVTGAVGGVVIGCLFAGLIFALCWALIPVAGATLFFVGVHIARTFWYDKF
jgi:DNA-binding helix-hairpin-helix protein with protein kinase domain